VSDLQDHVIPDRTTDIHIDSEKNKSCLFISSVGHCDIRIKFR
jgi:hypothetical protein